MLMNGPITLTTDKASSIDRIYEDVKDYDLVLTVDAPLADALNTRTDKPILGHFATTPRRLALDKIRTDGGSMEDKHDIFLHIIHETELDWKEAAYLLENVLNCWRETGSPDKILQYDRFGDETTRKLITLLKNTLNPYTAVEGYTVEDKRVAVVAPHQFTPLDRKVLPERYDSIIPFTEDTVELPSFNLFNSTTEIVHTVLEALKKLDPWDAAVVMKKKSDYMYLITAELDSKNIPYMVPRDITEGRDLRVFLNLIRYSFFKSGIKVKDVRPFLSDDPEPEKEEYFLRVFPCDSLNGLRSLMDNIPEMTFQELLDNKLFKNKLLDLRSELKELKLLNKTITMERLNSLTYYLETFDISSKKAERGVLIASPESSTFIDRPVIFYLGMDSSWTPGPPVTPWIDEKVFDKKKAEDFKLLLQNGERQYFMVQDRKMNKTVIPSFYFNEFTTDQIESFRDLKHKLRKKEITSHGRPFSKEETEAEPEFITTMSQSTLNTFAYCPKDHFFSKLVDTPDKRYFKRGKLFHDFAEFYVDHPEFEEYLEEILEYAMREMSPFLEEHEVPGIKTRFKIGFQNLISYLKDIKPRITGPEGYQKKYFDNIFSDIFERPITTKYTEAFFSNHDIGAKGVVDFIIDRGHIVDHKSGKKRSLKKIMTLSDIENMDQKPNFQAKMYIAHHRHYYPDTPVKFTFYHLLENERSVVSGDNDISENMLDIIYYPKNFHQMIHKEEVFRWLKSSKDRKKILKKLGYDAYRSFFRGLPFPALNKKELLNHPVTLEFTALCKEHIGDYKYVEKGCKSIVKELVNFRESHYFKEDIDLFQEFLRNKITEYNRCKTSSFPVKDADPDEIDNKDLVILRE
ncbi:MAG: PD-(D/E)XK nuclease family protein [Thermoplasmata archaeon]